MKPNLWFDRVFREWCCMSDFRKAGWGRTPKEAYDEWVRLQA